MSTDSLRGWIYIRGDDKGREAWMYRYCVVYKEEKLLKIFLQEKEYHTDCLSHGNNKEIKPTRREAWESKMQESELPARRSRSQSLITPPVHQKLAEFPRRIAQGIRSHISNSVSVQTIDTAEFVMKYQSLNSDHLHISRSQESLLNSRRRSSTVESMDLSISGKVSVRPIHPSILHKQFCFQVMSPHEVKYFSCRSADELNIWINSIKKSIQPTRDKQHRIDVGMSVWIVEAKGLSTKPKKRYYCEILLDKILYARTTTKTKADNLFWGENFNFEDLPDFSKLTINLYKDSETKNKKDKRKVIGSVDIMVENLDNNQETEKWYPVTIATNKGTNGEVPSIRLKIKYQRISILPLKAYNEMLSFIKNNYMMLCETLESAVSSKVKDEIATVILRVLQPIGKAQEFLMDIVMSEVNKLADENLVFRGNSFATKAMDAYMKMVGESYIQQTLGDFIALVYSTNDECEVDLSKLSTANIESNRQNLRKFVEKAWISILNSSSFFPRDLQETFHQFQQRCADRNKDLSNNLISSSIFLRFLCPAILSPSLFRLVQEYPNEKTSRTLTLVAKVIQNLANFTRFGGKEEYMEFMNEFVESEFKQMKLFLDKISSPPSARENHYDGSIDHGKELTMLFHILTEQMSKLNQDLQEQLRPLQFVLNSLQEAYHDVDRISNGTNDTAPPKKWASSSDLISDQKKDNITLTPVAQTKQEKLQEEFSVSHEGSVGKSRVSPRRAPRILPTPQHLIVAPEEIIVSSPYDLEKRRFSLPSTQSSFEDDLSSTASSVQLRRHSYLNAIGSDDEDQSLRRYTETSAVIEKRIRNTKLGYPNQIKLVNGSDTSTNADTKSKRDFSKSFTDTISTSKSKKKSPRERPWSLVLDYQSSPKEARPSTPPVITDRSRTLPAAGSPRTQRKASPLAIIDSITRSHTERDSDQSSPSSSPLPQRRTPQQSPRLLRVHAEQTPTPKQVIRTPSATSSSSSESSGSWRSSSFGSSSTDKVRRRHILPCTPNQDEARRNSGSITGYRDDDSKDDSLLSRNAIIHEEQDKSDLLRELEETKRALASTHEQLILQESSTHKLVASFKERLAETEKTLKKVREERDREVKDLLDRLVNVENELAKEKEEMQEIVQAKQRIIEAQEKRIKSLDSTNSRLVATLNQLKSKQDRDRSNQTEKKVNLEEQSDEYV